MKLGSTKTSPRSETPKARSAQPSSSHKTRSKKAAGESSHKVYGADSFEFCQSDLTEDKRVPVLITLPSNTNSTCLGDSCSPHIPADERLELPLINGFSTYVKPQNLKYLAEFLPEGSSMFLNSKVKYPEVAHLTKDSDAEVQSLEGRVERLPNIEKVWDRGFTGKGQKIVIIDSGIYPHPDLKDKVVEWVDFSREKQPKMMDDYGHGTHVAGVAAGTGAASNGEIKGIAPDAEIVGLRITTKAEAVKALQWCVDNKDRLGLDVVNMSLGEVARRGAKFDPWSLAVQKASNAGLTVCVAAGNEGPNPGSISTPGIDPSAITVGAYDSKGTPELDDDTVWRKSSQGPTIDGLLKPDVLAPGVAIFGPLSPHSQLDSEPVPHRGHDYFAITGTSQATPMISGLVAILKQANPSLNTEEIKAILKKASAAPPIHPALGKPAPDGAGLVDAEKALDLALAAKPQAAVA